MGLELNPVSNVPTVRPNSQTTDAIGQAAEQGFAIAQEQQGNVNRATILDKSAQLSTFQQHLLYNPDSGLLNQTGVNAVGITKPGLDQFDKQANAIMTGVNAPNVRNALAAQINEMREQTQRTLLDHEATQSKKYYVDQLSAGITLSQRNAAVNYTQPDIVAHELARQGALTRLLGRATGAGEDEMAAATLHANGQTHADVVQTMIAQGAWSQADAYMNQYGAQMPPGAYESLQRQSINAQDHATAQGERVAKQSADEVVKQMDDMLRANTLTVGTLNQYIGVLPKDDFRYFERALTPGASEVTRNPDLYANLMLRAVNGEDVRDDARAALHHNDIRLGDFDRLTEKVDRPGWYKSGAQFLSDASGASLMNPDPSAGRTKADMLDAWNQYAKDHPKATDREARDAYQSIAENASLVKLNGMRLPRFMVGPRVAPNMDQTEEATVRAHSSGQLSDFDYGREMVLIKRWRDQLTSANAPAPKLGQQ